MAFLIGAITVSAHGAKPLRVATFNNQLDCKAPVQATWKVRWPAVKQLLQEEDFDVVGMQEPYIHQVADMDKFLSAYGRVGKHSVNGNDVGHFNPIYYKREFIEVIDEGCFWFSETPQVVASKSWDSSSTRMCVWAHFRDKRNGKDFFHFNAHIDHRGWKARAESIRLLIDMVEAIAGDMPAVCTGDFNFSELDGPYRVIKASLVVDDSFVVARKTTNGQYVSWNDYRPLQVTELPRHYDHVLVSKGSKVKSWRMAINTYDGVYPSDHFPIVIEWQPW